MTITFSNILHDSARRREALASIRIGQSHIGSAVANQARQDERNAQAAANLIEEYLVDNSEADFERLVFRLLADHHRESN